VIHAIYDRIVVERPRFVSVRLTSAAYQHGAGARVAGCCNGAPDRCRTRDFNLHHPDRGPRWMAGRGEAASMREGYRRGELPLLAPHGRLTSSLPTSQAAARCQMRRRVLAFGPAQPKGTWPISGLDLPQHRADLRRASRGMARRADTGAAL